MRAELLEPVPAGEPMAVVGWTLGLDGRKHRSATALLAPTAGSSPAPRRSGSACD